MSGCVPAILLLGHSFVRLPTWKSTLSLRAARNFHISQSGHVSLLGTGGRTVDKVLKYDLKFGSKSMSPIS
jgi:hypothetical protein